MNVEMCLAMLTMAMASMLAMAPELTVDKKTLNDLSSMRFINSGQNIVISGPTGMGKSYLACALGNSACRSGISVQSPNLGIPVLLSIRLVQQIYFHLKSLADSWCRIVNICREIRLRIIYTIGSMNF